jgi:hypothetical protein
MHKLLVAIGFLSGFALGAWAQASHPGTWDILRGKYAEYRDRTAPCPEGYECVPRGEP